MTLTFSEILDKVKLAKTRDERIRLLRSFDSNYFRNFLQFIFHPACRWSFTREDLDNIRYTPCPLRGIEGRVYKESQKMWYFVDGKYPNMTKQKKIIMLTEILENIDRNDAELIMLILKDGIAGINKKYDANINALLISEAFPGILPLPIKESVKETTETKLLPEESKPVSNSKNLSEETLEKIGSTAKKVVKPVTKKILNPKTSGVKIG